MSRAAIEAIKDVALNTKNKYETLKIIIAELLAEEVVLNTMCLPNAVSTLETFLEETRDLFYKTIESSTLSYDAIVKMRNQNVEDEKLLAARALLKETFLNNLDFLQGYIDNISMVIFFDRLGITDKEERDRLSLEIMNLIFKLGLHAKSVHELRDRREKEAAGLTELDAAYYWNGLPHKEAETHTANNLTLCPIPGCKIHMDIDFLMCNTHMRLLKPRMQSELDKALEVYEKSEKHAKDAEKLHSVQAKCVDYVRQKAALLGI